MSDLFTNVELAPPVEVFALVAAYNDDSHPQKVNLGIGGSIVAYPRVLQSRYMLWTGLV